MMVPMTLLTALMLAAGLVLLVGGAEGLVRGGSGLARAAGISPVVVGLTVVAFGTSAPELAVTVGGARSGAAGIAVGNVLGSNIFNVLVILGLSAVVAGLVVHQRIVRLDVPLVVGVTAVAWAFAADGSVGRVEGAALAAAAVAYSVAVYVAARRERPGIAAEYAEAFAPPTPEPSGWRRTWLPAGLVVAGLAALVAGAELLVGAATDVAEALGVSDLVIGLTVVAAGTSMPELATSVVAAARGERDIAVGNIVGSNLFNLLAVLGVAALIAPDGVAVADEALALDFPVAFAAVLLALPLLAAGMLLSRLDGALLLVCFALYATVLALGAVASPLAETARVALLAGLTAATLVALVVVGVAALRRRRAARRDGGAAS